MIYFFLIAMVMLVASIILLKKTKQLLKKINYSLNTEFEVYRTDEDLADSFCDSLNCSNGPVGETNEPSCYGCDSLDKFVEENMHKVVGEDGFWEYLKAYLERIQTK